MFQFFKGIAAIVTTVVSLVVNVFGILEMILVSMVRAVAWLFACIAYLPPFLTAFVVVPIAVAICFQILNKGD